eukprot:COSAG06_NODE_26904_length_605_cov_0.806324_1_plen_150_part_01
MSGRPIHEKMSEWSPHSRKDAFLLSSPHNGEALLLPQGKLCVTKKHLCVESIFPARVCVCVPSLSWQIIVLNLEGKPEKSGPRFSSHLRLPVDRLCQGALTLHKVLQVNLCEQLNQTRLCERTHGSRFLSVILSLCLSRACLGEMIAVTS